MDGSRDGSMDGELDESMDGEVYGCALQFINPKYYSSASSPSTEILACNTGNDLGRGIPANKP